MQRKRAQIVLPEDLLAEMDQFLGHSDRSAFLADLVRKEIQRRRLLAALNSARGAWNTENHEELQQGPTEFVKRLREENERRLPNGENADPAA